MNKWLLPKNVFSGSHLLRISATANLGLLRFWLFWINAFRISVFRIPIFRIKIMPYLKVINIFNVIWSSYSSVSHCSLFNVGHVTKSAKSWHRSNLWWRDSSPGPLDFVPSAVITGPRHYPMFYNIGSCLLCFCVLCPFSIFHKQKMFRGSCRILKKVVDRPTWQ